MRVIGNGKAIVDMLKEFGLCEYEAKMYFTLLTLGKGKVTTITRKAAVPQSKAYDVLERLIAKGFVEISRTERPKEYRAKALGKVAVVAISREEKHIQRLHDTCQMLQSILEAVTPAHNRYSSLRLFSPKYRGR
jgi:sugar-specific transcriptional regulator TrmB